MPQINHTNVYVKTTLIRTSRRSQTVLFWISVKYVLAHRMNIRLWQRLWLVTKNRLFGLSDRWPQACSSLNLGLMYDNDADGRVQNEKGKLQKMNREWYLALRMFIYKLQARKKKHCPVVQLTMAAFCRDTAWHTQTHSKRCLWDPL